MAAEGFGESGGNQPPEARCKMPHPPLMSYLSLPVGELRPRYRAVVIGSGYGGAVAAARLAERFPAPPGERLSICVLERGAEWHAGDFPATFFTAVRQLQADGRFGRIGRRTGLFDVRINRDVSALVGCGLGGTSLINANAMIPPEPDVFQTAAWPEEFRNDPALLEPHLRDVLCKIGAERCPENVLPLKSHRLFEARGPESSAQRPKIAVTFRSGFNRHGVRQQRCVMCGDCVTGCNHGAKNTLDKNYLATACRLGVEIFCGIEVRSLEEGPDGGWRLHTRLLDRGWSRFGYQEFELRAGAVFVASGTMGSTEILLRSAERHRVSLSPRVGDRFSGNGDVIAFSYNGDEPVDGFGYGPRIPPDASAGPTITGILDERHGASRLMIQDAAVPGALATPVRFLAPIISRLTRLVGHNARDLSLRHIAAELFTMLKGAGHGALNRSETFLVMCRDVAGTADRSESPGTMTLVGDRLRIVWPGIGSAPIFQQVHARLSQLTKAMNGRFVANPVWTRPFGRRLLTVHPLGGCPMADSGADGVVNSKGQVFSGQGRAIHESLFVCDGAIVPAALGANPAVTIGALADRIATQATLPVHHEVARRDCARTSAEPGISYAERLTGTASLDGVETRIELVLHLSSDNVERLITDARHAAQVIGLARTPELDPARREWMVSDGTLNVLVTDPRSVDTSLLVYRLKLTNGRDEIFLRGHKTINLETCRQPWKAISSFRFVLNRYAWMHTVGPLDFNFADACDQVDDATTNTGRVANSVTDALRLVFSIAITKERNIWRRCRITLRFLWFFVDGVVQNVFWLFQRTPRADPFTRPRLDVPEKSDSIDDKRADGPPRFRLTAFGPRGGRPVILAPGFGMSADAFHVGDPSLVRFLTDLGYQVWLLDYRASDRLAISLTQFTLDELVVDFDAAITAVHQRTGQPVRMIAHCVASLVTTMMLLKGMPARHQLHAVVLSQSLAFMDHPLINRIKAALRLPTILRLLGFNPVLTADVDLRSSWADRAFDRLLRLYPTKERCTSGVCRGLIFLYGEVVRHEQIDHETHELLYDLFDRANLRSFEHLARMIVRGQIVDHQGKNIYLRCENGQHLTMRIALMQGKQNRLFRPGGLERTERWFKRYAKCPDLITRIEIDGYGHLDNFIGKNAAHQVFPQLLAAIK